MSPSSVRASILSTIQLSPTMAGGNRPSPNKRRVPVRHKKKPTSTTATNEAPIEPIPRAPSIHPGVPSTAPLERCIARILLLRFKSDVARLYSSHLTRICQNTIPALMLDVIVLTGPGWIAANAGKEELKAYLRGPISMDLRQAGERVATKSVLWSYTAIRHFVSRRTWLSLSRQSSGNKQAELIPRCG